MMAKGVPVLAGATAVTIPPKCVICTLSLEEEGEEWEEGRRGRQPVRLPRRRSSC
jgi:hypothetical protein